MQYELINPSDAYTFIALNHEVAALTVFALSTAYGANPQTGDDIIPVFVFGGAEEWYKVTFRRTIEEGFSQYKKEIADALDSFMLGEFEDRRRYNSALSLIDDEAKKEQFKEEWQDGRSSLNDIGSYAHNLSKRLISKRTDSEGNDEQSD